MIDKLMNGLRTLTRTRETSFAETASKLARGESMTPVAVQAVLDEAAKTPEELKAAVELATKRMAWAADLNAAKDCDRQRKQIAKQVESAKRDLAKAERIFNDAVAPLDSRLIEIQGIEATASAAERGLRETCSEDVQVEWNAAAARRMEVTRHAASLRKRAKLIETAESDMAEGRRMGAVATQGGGYNRGQHFIDEAKMHERQGKAALAELPAAEKEVAVAEKAVEVAEAKVLVA